MRSCVLLVPLTVLLFACTDTAKPSTNTDGSGVMSTGGTTATLPPGTGGMGSGGIGAGSGGVSATGGMGATGGMSGSGGTGPGTGGVSAGSGGVTADAGDVASGAMDSGIKDAGPVEVGHPKRFIASIHGSADKLVYVDVEDPQQNWELDVPDGIQDFQLIGNDTLLVGYKFNFGYFEVDLATHQMGANVRDFLTRSEAILTSVKRLDNGHTLIMAQGLSGAQSDLEVWEVDNDKKVYDKRTFASCCGNLRVVRLTADEHFLVGSGNALVELDGDGNEVARKNTGGSPTYMGLKTADGTYYATNGHGGQILAFPPGGQSKVIGGKSSSSAQDVTIYQPGQFQILQNGNIVITNWTAENGGMGKQLVEYTADGEMVWSWDDPAVRPQGMETLLVLDNLDPSVLNDDRDGVLKPVK
jgi:hypothetical protein